MQDFRHLRVWKKAFALALNVRRATGTFPRTGFSELKAQMTSAAESILHNIVEGCGADTQKEFARFLQVSIRSSMELEGQIRLAQGYEILPDQWYRALTAETVETRRMLFGLRKKVLAPEPSGSISHAQRPPHNGPLTPPDGLLDHRT